MLIRVVELMNTECVCDSQSAKAPYKPQLNIIFPSGYEFGELQNYHGLTIGAPDKPQFET